MHTNQNKAKQYVFNNVKTRFYTVNSILRGVIFFSNAKNQVTKSGNGVKILFIHKKLKIDMNMETLKRGTYL